MNCEKCQSNYVYHVNTVKVCFECIEYDNRSLRNENAKLKDVLVEISQETRVIEGVECSTNGAMIAAEVLKDMGKK